MDRRTFLRAAPAGALIPIAGCAAPEAHAAPEAVAPTSWAAIRERVRLVGELFADGERTAGRWPGAVPADEVAAIIAMTDDEMDQDWQAHPCRLLAFAWNYNLSLDWLLADDLKPALASMRLIYAEARAAANDPAPAAYAKWKRLHDEEAAQFAAAEAALPEDGNGDAYERRVDAIGDGVADEVDDALRQVAAITAPSAAGMLAQIRAIEESDQINSCAGADVRQLVHSLRASLEAMAERLA
jgi:hypothetical protein